MTVRRVLGHGVSPTPSVAAAASGPSAYGRRAALARIGAALTAVVAAPARPRAATAFPETAYLLVAGPDGGRLDRWAAEIAPALGAALPSGTEVSRANLGGVDGVTGANRFDARAASDGSTVLMVPGDAALAWLAGDPRAQFDAGRWVPVLGGVDAAVVAGRVRISDLRSQRRVRVVGAGPTGPLLPALLGLELLGVPVDADFGATDERAADRALAEGRADLAVLRGPTATARLAALSGAGVAPLFRFGRPDAQERPDAAADVPSFEELHRALRGSAPAGPLYAAWRAAAAATQLAFGLVLPPLTPAMAVAVWRRAGQATALSPDVWQVEAAEGVRPLPPQAILATTHAVAVEADTLLELRGWLASRWGWQPA